MARNDPETLLDITRRREQVNRERIRYAATYGDVIGSLLFEYIQASPGTEVEGEKRDLLALVVVRAIQNGDETTGANAVKALLVASEIKLENAIKRSSNRLIG